VPPQDQYRVKTADLHSFKKHVSETLKDTMSKSPWDALVQMPASKNHEERRRWQATHAVYKDEPELFRKETSVPVVEFT